MNIRKAGPVVLVIVLGLVVLFGIGQFFITPVSQVNPTTPTPNPTVPTNPPTQIIAYEPPLITSSTPVEKGSCWTNSIAAPYRADAWRCTVGNAIQDPCFQIPNASGTVFCGADPTNPTATTTFVLELTKPLPQPQVLPGPPPPDWSWLVQLADGTPCSPFTGTLPSPQVSYGCAPGPLGNDIYIFNNFNESSSAWMAQVGTLAASTSGPPTIAQSQEVPIEAIWQ